MRVCGMILGVSASGSDMGSLPLVLQSCDDRPDLTGFGPVI
jgi:hypothetical protein